MPQKVSGEKVRKCKELPGKLLENLISQESGRLPIIFYRHNIVVLAGYARLNFASKKPGTQQRGHHLKHLNLLCARTKGVRADHEKADGEQQSHPRI